MSVIKPPMHIQNPYWQALQGDHASDILTMIYAPETDSVYNAAKLTNALKCKQLQHRHHNRPTARLYSDAYHFAKSYYAGKFTGEDAEYFRQAVM